MKVIINLSPPKMDKITRCLHYSIVNREEIREKARIYYQKNKEEISRKRKIWYQNNPDRMRQYKRQCYLNKHPDSKPKPRKIKLKNITITSPVIFE